jgi:hypothetical protein
MALVNLKEVNSYVQNLLDRVSIRELTTDHAQRIREWFVSNMSNIGRYAHGNQEKFGSRNPSDTDDNIQGRQDGWQSVTEEVPHLDHITYGTGILYINGEMEVPRYEETSGNHIKNDEFCHVDKTGEVHHFEVNVSSAKGNFTETQNGSNVIQGYAWNFPSSTPSGEEGSGKWRYDSIIAGTVNVALPSYNSEWSAGTASTHVPGIRTTFNDAEIYHLDNERNHYPYIIVNSGQPASINTLLETLQGQNGMYDDELPTIASTDTYPPSSLIEITEEGAAAIMDFISPINETPFYTYVETQTNDNYEAATDAGKSSTETNFVGGKPVKVKAPKAGRAATNWEDKQKELDTAKQEESAVANKGTKATSSTIADDKDSIIPDLTPEQIVEVQTKYGLGTKVTKRSVERVKDLIDLGLINIEPGHLTTPKGRN